MRHALPLTLFLLLGFSLAAQTRDESATAAGATWATLACTRNADGSIECAVCTTPIVTSLGAEERPCGRPRVLKTTNANRIDLVGAALVPAALRAARFNVDAGSP